MQYNYDTLAPVYDRLSRLVFGKAQVNAQLYLLQVIPPNARILIIGGGTGWILDSIAERHQQDLSITYVDASAKMIALAKRRDVKGNEITFLNATIETAPLPGLYDIVLTPFIFDNIPEAELPPIFTHIEAALTPTAIWLHCDFRPPTKIGHRMLVGAMYAFFRLLCGISASHLPDVDTLFRKRNWHLQEQKTFFNGLIEAGIYTRL